MRLQEKEKALLKNFLEPLIMSYPFRGDVLERIDTDRLTSPYLSELQRMIDTVLFTCGRTGDFFEVDEKEFAELQTLAGDAHYALSKYRRYEWYAPRR